MCGSLTKLKTKIWEIYRKYRRNIEGNIEGNIGENNKGKYRGKFCRLGKNCEGK
jgi:hypothetical protein